MPSLVNNNQPVYQDQWCKQEIFFFGGGGYNLCIIITHMQQTILLLKTLFLHFTCNEEKIFRRGCNPQTLPPGCATD